MRPTRSSEQRTASSRRPGATLAVALVLALAAATAPAAPAATAAAAGASGGGAGPDLCWPLDLPEHYLTSGFMEWRPGRFHAGLDLKTRSRSGMTVRAVEDGDIVRLRAAPGGYGLAVHLRGRVTGHTYVYAHLERLADRLQAELRARQEARGSWTVDASLPPGRLPVHRGEVIALSGESGTTGPHLHLEVRNAAEMPLDPQDWGLAVDDGLRPRIRRLRALPVEPSSRLEGQLSALSITVPAVAEAALPALHVRGAVALAAEVEDASDRAGHRLAPDLLRVWLDERAVYVAANDSFTFAEGPQSQLEWLAAGGPPCRWLHRWPGVTLPGRRGGAWSAAPGGLPPGRHRVVVEALDHAGNRAAVRFELVVAAADSGAALPRPAAAGWRADPVRTLLVLPEGHRLWLTPFLELERSGDAGAVTSPAGAGAAAENPAAPAGWLARPLLAAGGAGQEAGAGAPIAGAPPLPRKEIHRASDALLAEAALWVVPDTLSVAEAAAAASGQGLRALGPALRFAAGWWPAAAAVPEALPPAGEAADPRDGVYVEEGGSWSWIAPAADVPPGAGAEFGLRAPGRYALLRDVQAPTIRPPAPDTLGLAVASPDPAVTAPRWPLLAVGVDDAGSGVDPSSLRASLPGRALLPQPDPVRDRLLIELPDDLPPGRYVVTVEAADRAGNRTRRELPFRLSARPAGAGAE